MAFKVKTTAPKLYCVRPNASIVEPGASINISIILQGFSQPLPAGFKCKDKFLIVSLPAPELTDASKVGESWSELEAKHQGQLDSKKLRVNYVILDEDDAETSVYDEKPHASEDSKAVAGTAAAAVGGAAAAVGLSAPSIPSHNESTPERPANSSINDSYVTPARDDAAAGDLQKELDASNAEINNLSTKLDKNEPEKQAVAAKADEPVLGVSLSFAVLLVLLAFLLGWVFF